ALGIAYLALAGDDQHEGGAFVMRTLQEAEQRAVCASLRHAVQIDARVDLLLAAREFCAVAPADRRERRRLRLWRRRNLHRRWRTQRSRGRRGPRLRAPR